jgi:hypothetical protein
VGGRAPFGSVRVKHEAGQYLIGLSEKRAVVCTCEDMQKAPNSYPLSQPWIMDATCSYEERVELSDDSKASKLFARPVRLAYQPPANGIFLSEQTSHQPNEQAGYLCPTNVVEATTAALDGFIPK